MSLIISIVGVVIAVIEIALITYKYIQEAKRQKYMDTIQIMESLINETYFLRENYRLIYSDVLFDKNNICSSDELYKMTMSVLTR